MARVDFIAAEDGAAVALNTTPGLSRNSNFAAGVGLGLTHADILAVILCEARPGYDAPLPVPDFTGRTRADPLTAHRYVVELRQRAGCPVGSVTCAGHGVAVLVKIHAHCIDGQAAANQRITDALGSQDDGQDPGDEGESDNEPAA